MLCMCCCVCVVNVWATLSCTSEYDVCVGDVEVVVVHNVCLLVMMLTLL